MSLLESQAVTDFDRRVDELADRLRGNPAADKLFYSLSEAANHSILWHLLSAGIFLTGGPEAKRSARHLTLLVATESVLVNGPIKMAFKRERPDDTTDRPHRLRKPLTSSFPSGHASAAACVVAAADVGGVKKGLLVVLAVLVAWSRVHVRIHHGSDIVGGVIIGTAIGKIEKHLLSR